ncbi:hypothetical protein IW261DRAFT_118104 [Armillaria novae-zelandiae]|uniref:C2H2-type domain-containing protein n=1 Tax=Armillaria novae-zelandiae TaxID=153914 RepID=A0AA39P9M6_9AGAR|nr:hypothetical protein IW261DRAFT_118104 [Armillaria novae-zelandiae]
MAEDMSFRLFIEEAEGCHQLGDDLRDPHDSSSSYTDGIISPLSPASPYISSGLCTPPPGFASSGRRPTNSAYRPVARPEEYDPCSSNAYSNHGDLSVVSPLHDVDNPYQPSTSLQLHLDLSRYLPLINFDGPPEPSPPPRAVSHYNPRPYAASVFGPSFNDTSVSSLVPYDQQISETSQNVERVSSSKPVRVKKSAHSPNKEKWPVTFMCPVRGCGSTFVKSFNLKAHIRSHNEENPFVCPWPGCGKGFTRQHDCKRHEQLHRRYRPFSCGPCGKMFARMDALNQHLSSEGGAECAKFLELTRAGPEGLAGGDAAGSKHEQ